MEPAWEWVIERVGQSTAVYHLNRLLEVKQRKNPADTKLIVGRRDNVDICCNGNTVSRIHCELTYKTDAQHWFVTEKSTNGIFINSNKDKIPTRTPTQLNDQDTLGIGAPTAPTQPEYFVFKLSRISVNNGQLENGPRLSPHGNFAERVKVNEQPSLAEYSVISAAKPSGFPSVTPTSSAPSPSAISSHSTGLSTSKTSAHSAVTSMSNGNMGSAVASASQHKSNISRVSLSATVIYESPTDVDKETENDFAAPSSSKYLKSKPQFRPPSQHSSPSVAITSASKEQTEQEDRSYLSSCYVRLVREKEIERRAASSNINSPIILNDDDESDNVDESDDVFVPKLMTTVVTRNYRRIMSDSEDSGNDDTTVPPISTHSIKQEKPDSVTIKKEVISPEAPVAESRKQTNSKFVIEKLFPNPEQYCVSGSNRSTGDFYSPTLECIDLVDDPEEEDKNTAKSNTAEPEYADADALENYSDDDIFLRMFEDDGHLSDIPIKEEPISSYKASTEEDDDDDEIQLWSISLSQTPTKREITDHSDSPLIITLDGDDEDVGVPKSPVSSLDSEKRRRSTEASSGETEPADAQFWPQLSQNFYDGESEEEEEQQQQQQQQQQNIEKRNEKEKNSTEKRPSGTTSKYSDKLEQLTKTDRFKSTPKTIMTCDPKPLEVNKRRRLSLTTDDSSSKEASASHVSASSKTSRTIKIISPRFQAPVSRRRTSKKNETIEKLKLTVEGGKTWIKSSTSSSKKSEISTNPVPAVGTGLSKKFQSVSNIVIPHKSKAAPVVKVKTTAISRSDLLFKDLIESSDPKEALDAQKAAKKAVWPCDHEYRSSKRKSTVDEDEDEEVIPLTTSDYIPKKKRVARVSEDNGLSRSAGGSKSSIASRSSKGKSLASKSKLPLDAFSETLIALGKPLNKKPDAKKRPSSSRPSPPGPSPPGPSPPGPSPPGPSPPGPNDSGVKTIEGARTYKSCMKRFPQCSPGSKKRVKIAEENNRTHIFEPKPHETEDDPPRVVPLPYPYPSFLPSPLLPSPLSSGIGIPTSLPQPPLPPPRLPPPRLPPPPSQRHSLPDTHQLHYAGKQLISDMKMRILKWNYEWIHEQKNFAVLPPLLQKASDSLRELHDKPVNSTYTNLEQYFDVFHPLMLLELWAQMTKEYEQLQKPNRWNILVNDITVNNGFTLLTCSTTVDNLGMSPRESDLVVLKFTGKTKKPPLLGIVENVQQRRDRHQTVYNFTLCVRAKSVKTIMLDKTKVAMERVHSLWLLFKQLKIHGRLSFSPLCQVILSISKPGERTFKFIQKEPDFEVDPLLNPSQRTAVVSVAVTMVEAPMHEPRIALIQGPPGTGKSHVIVQIVKSMIQQHLIKTKTLPRILICAPSNFAVDEIAYRLLQEKKKLSKTHPQIKLVRVGVLGSMNDRVKEISVDHLSENIHRFQCASQQSPASNTIAGGKEEIKILNNKKKGILSQLEAANAKNNRDQSRKLGRELERLEENLESHQESLAKSMELHYKFFKDSDKKIAELRKEVINEADIICSTLNSCNSKDMDSTFVSKRNNRPFLCCIIDEASQCTEPESLTPLILGVNKLVMVGDPEQLPATVCSQVSKERRFDQSLFNRFFSYLPFNPDSNRASVLMLNTQYRMHPDICHWPSKFFYANLLLTTETLVRTSLFNSYRVFNVLDSEETSDGHNYSNECEAELVARLVQVLVTTSLAGSRSIGVITFYQKQRSLIQEKLKTRKIQERLLKRVKVNTVDAFQGQEEDIIIISCVRATRNYNKKIGFVNSLQRLNVALTRARESLFVCGNFDTLRTDETWKDMIEDATKRSLTHNITSVFELATLRPLLIKQ